MRKLFTIFVILALAVSMSAQSGTGRITGKVTDESGVALPGVNVTLTSSLIPTLYTTTNAQGMYRFLALPASKDYKIKTELDGFNSEVRESVVVMIGSSADINLSMKQGTLQEEVRVKAVTPVVETKKTSVGQNMTRDILQSLPSARDPWVMLQQAPAVMIDRENVGGSESGQQSDFSAMGNSTDQWTMDGITITDAASISSPGYYDFDSFEEMNFVVGGADVTVQGAGVQVNLVTRRGGNDLSLGGRFFFTDGTKFQADNITDAIIAEGVTRTNRIKVIKDFGFNVGGPIIPDKAYWWISYGVQDILGTNLRGVTEGTDLSNYAAKINLNLIENNRFEAFMHIGGKEKQARDSSESFPAGYHQYGSYHFGSPIFKLQDEHMFGENFFVTAKFSWSDSGFRLIPEDDLGRNTMVRYDSANSVYLASHSAYLTTRPQTQVNFLAQYFNDDFLGASHEIKFGIEYADKGLGSTNSYPGNVFSYENYSSPQIDFDGDGTVDLLPQLRELYIGRSRGMDIYSKVKHATAFFEDTVTFNRLTLKLGLRWDNQAPVYLGHSIAALDATNDAIKDNFSSGAISAIENFLPALEVGGINPDEKWSYITPRLSLIYDILGDGKTMLKLSYNQYRGFMGSGSGGSFAPRGTGGYSYFWWLDAASLGGNGDKIVDVNELFWSDFTTDSPTRVFDDSGNISYPRVSDAYGFEYGGFDINNPQNTSPNSTTYRDYSSSRTQEFLITLDKQIMDDFAVAFDLIHRRNDQFSQSREWDPEIGDSSIQNISWYVQHSTVPDIPGVDMGEEGVGKPIYLMEAGHPYTGYFVVDKQPENGGYNTYNGANIRFTKRLSNKWMFNGSFTLQKQSTYQRDSRLSRTNEWYSEGGPLTASMGGGSGKISVPFYQTWMFKFSGLYQLPYGFDISFTSSARQGNPITHSVYIYDYSAPSSRNRGATVYLDNPLKERMPNFFRLDLRLQKSLRLGDKGRVYFMADLFNVMNSATALRRYGYDPGTYYPHSGYLSKNVNSYKLNEVFNPRVIRFGVRFEI